MPQYSIVIFSYDRPALLGECLESLASLDYDREQFEVIVADDGSPSDYAPIVERFSPRMRVSHLRLPHLGISAARNSGLAAALASKVAFVADDYRLPPDYLRVADWFFETYPDARVLSFNVRSVGRRPAVSVQQAYHELALLTNSGALPDSNGVIESYGLPASRAAVFDRRAFEKVGTFDEKLRSGEDGDLGRRLAAAGIAVHFIPSRYIDHREEKGLREFLAQRRSYAESYFRVTHRQDNPEPWTAVRALLAWCSTIARWARTSWRYGRVARFAIFLPGIALFLAVYYSTLVRCEGKHAA